MSTAYHVAADEGLISVQVSTEIDLVDLYELAKGVLSSADYADDLPLLVDLRGMRLELVREATEPFSRFIVKGFSGRKGSTAVVIDGAMDRELCAAVYWLACAVGSAEVFDDYDHAMKWLIRREFVSAEAQVAI